MRKHPVNVNNIKRFMDNHYTSKRAEMLAEILEKHNIALPNKNK